MMETPEKSVDKSFRRLGPLAVLLMLAAITGLGGCAAASYAAHAIVGPTKTVDVPARYRGLEGKYVAVMVAADEFLLFRHPQAPMIISTALSAQLADNVHGVQIMNPQQVMQFQRSQPYWATLPYDELIEQMKVDRIVMVDLAEYRTREPGQRFLWQGVLTANVGVIDADAPDPNHMMMHTPIHVQFPASGVGVLESDEQTMSLALSTLFAQQAGQLFYDHQREVPR